MTEANTNSENLSKEAAAEANSAQNVNAETSSEAAEQNTESQADKLLAELAEWKNKAAYFAAEMDNMKKRFVREKAEVIKMANEELVKGILPVFDNLDLAIKSIRDVEKTSADSAQASKLFENLMKGVEMTLTHFQQTLERSGVQKLEAQGVAFDPSLHEAMGQSSDEKIPDGHVSSVFQNGFMLHGRVIRTAKVIVNKIS